MLYLSVKTNYTRFHFAAHTWYLMGNLTGTLGPAGSALPFHEGLRSWSNVYRNSLSDFHLGLSFRRDDVVPSSARSFRPRYIPGGRCIAITWARLILSRLISTAGIFGDTHHDIDIPVPRDNAILSLRVSRKRRRHRAQGERVLVTDARKLVAVSRSITTTTDKR